MSGPLHIVHKDIRRLRWVLALWVAVLAARVTLSLNGAAVAGDSLGSGLFMRELSGAIATVEWLLMALIVARLVHEEPLVGFTAFWLTRPYDIGRLIRAKLLVAMAMLVGMPLIADVAAMSVLEAGPPALVRAGSTLAVGYVTTALSLMVIATLTPSFGVFTLTILGIAVGASMVLASIVGIATLWADAPSDYTPPGVPDATPGTVMLVVYVCAALAVIIYQYRYRRWRMAAGLAVTGVAAAIVVPLLWPWPFARGEEARPGAWTAGAAAAHDPSWGTLLSDVERFGRGPARRHVNARVTLSGMPPEVMMQSIGVRSRLQFEDGTAIESSQRGGFGSSFTTAAAQAALAGVEVLNPLEAFDQREAWTPMVTLTEEEFASYRGRPGRLDANVDFHLTRTREVGVLPLMPGAAMGDRVSRIEIVATQRRTDSRDVTLRQWQARSPLSTDPPGQQRLFVLRHRSGRQALMGGQDTAWPIGSWGSSPTALLRFPFAMMGVGVSAAAGGGGFSAATLFLRFPGRGFGKAPRLDAAWFDEAELVVLETVPEGVVTRSLTIEPFVVPER